MSRDIDYAAKAVQTAVTEKFGRKNDLTEFVARANDNSISIQHGERIAEGTRDRLLAILRDSPDYETLWDSLLAARKSAK